MLGNHNVKNTYAIGSVHTKRIVVRLKNNNASSQILDKHFQFTNLFPKLAIKIISDSKELQRGTYRQLHTYMYYIAT